MKVIFLSRLFYPHIGGVEKHVFEISNILAKKGHEITIISEKSRGNKLGRERLLALNKLITLKSIPVPHSETEKKWTIWKWLYNNKSILENADVIHCHDVFFWYLPFRIIYPRKKVFTTFHGYEGRCPPLKKAVAVRKISELMSDGNICVGNFIKKWYKTKPTLVTYGGVSKCTPRFNRTVRKKLRIIFIGRIEEDNGVSTYNNILDALERDGVNYNFIAFGSGSMQELFLKKGNVTTSINVLDEIRNSDIVFASSYLSILESLSQCRMVVSVITDPIKKDYLLDTPFSKWIEVSNNCESLLEVIKDYHSSPDKYQDNLVKGYSWASKQTWEKLAFQYESLWQGAYR